jgi:hypothetical protein
LFCAICWAINSFSGDHGMMPPVSLPFGPKTPQDATDNPSAAATANLIIPSS